jgi:hypothetical protein
MVAKFKKLFIITIPLLVTCSNNNDIVDPTLWSEPYSGITYTDNFGMVLKNDPDD